MRLNWNIAVGLQILLENNGSLTFEEIAKNTLISVLGSIQAGNIDGLLSPTENLRKKVQGIINANAATHATMRNISLISTVLTGLGIGENVQ